MILLRLRRGFTLIELLIVIVIIGILAVGLVPKVIDAPKKARDTVRKKDVDSIKIAIESYYADNSKYPTQANGSFPAGFNNYFQGSKIPTPPSGTTFTDYFYYNPSTNTGCYLVGAEMESKTAGNSSEDLAQNAQTGKSCSIPLGPGNGKYYYAIGGSY